MEPPNIQTPFVQSSRAVLKLFRRPRRWSVCSYWGMLCEVVFIILHFYALILRCVLAVHVLLFVQFFCGL